MEEDDQGGGNKITQVHLKNGQKAVEVVNISQPYESTAVV